MAPSWVPQGAWWELSPCSAGHVRDGPIGGVNTLLRGPPLLKSPGFFFPLLLQLQSIKLSNLTMKRYLGFLRWKLSFTFPHSSPPHHPALWLFSLHPVKSVGVAFLTFSLCLHKHACAASLLFSIKGNRIPDVPRCFPPLKQPWSWNVYLEEVFHSVERGSRPESGDDFPTHSQWQSGTITQEFHKSWLNFPLGTLENKMTETL